MINELTENCPMLTKKDFVSDQAVRWCPGCGDYVILNSLQKVFAGLDHAKENMVCVSGIGCSSRLPYYMNTFGMHTLHGRAIATATGMKLANPGLSVWVITGDGDCMAIGGNHFIHGVRRNLDMNIIIFNNKIYGMTKGQASPTTPTGYKTKTTPEGSYENPFNIGELALGASATFYARVPDNDPKLMEKVMFEAYRHKGTAVIEVLQNCVIFSDGIHEMITDKSKRDDNQLVLEHGEFMLFGGEHKYGLRVNGMELEKVALGNEDPEKLGVIRHDATRNIAMHMALTRMKLPEFPVAMGVIRKQETPTFEKIVHDAIAGAGKNGKKRSVTDLIHSGNTWEI